MEDEDFRKLKELVEKTVDNKFAPVKTAVDSVLTEITVLKQTFVSTNIYQSVRDEKAQLEKDVVALKDELKQLGDKTTKFKKQVADEAIADLFRQQVSKAPHPNN